MPDLAVLIFVAGGAFNDAALKSAALEWPRCTAKRVYSGIVLRYAGGLYKTPSQLHSPGSE